MLAVRRNQKAQTQVLQTRNLEHVNPGPVFARRGQVRISNEGLPMPVNTSLAGCLNLQVAGMFLNAAGAGWSQMQVVSSLPDRLTHAQEPWADELQSQGWTPQLQARIVEKGERPSIGSNTPAGIADLIRACCKPTSSARPTMEEVVRDVQRLATVALMDERES